MTEASKAAAIAGVKTAMDKTFKPIDKYINSFLSFVTYLDDKDVECLVIEGGTQAEVMALGQTVKIGRERVVKAGIEEFVWVGEGEGEEIARVLNATKFSVLTRTAQTDNAYNKAGDIVFSIFATVAGTQRFLNEKRDKGLDAEGTAIRGWIAGKEMRANYVKK